MARQTESRSLGRERQGRNPSALLQKRVSIHSTYFTSFIPGGRPGKNWSHSLGTEGSHQEDQSDHCESGGDSPRLVEVQGVSRGSCTRVNLLACPPGCLGAEGRLAHKLFRDLFANYTSALRPVADTDQTLNVTLEVTLSQIIDMVHCGYTTVECAGDSVKEFGGGGLGLFTKQLFSVNININNNSY